MVLSDLDIKLAITENILKIEPFSEDQLNAASYDLSLSEHGFKIKSGEIIDTNIKQLPLEEFTLEKTGFNINPGDYILVETEEKLTFNNSLTGLLSTSGSKAQAGLQVLNGSLISEPNTNNKIILEIQNVSANSIVIYPGTKLVKCLFLKLLSNSSGEEASTGFFERNNISE